MNHRALTRLVAPTVALGLAVSGCSSDASSEPPADPAPTSASPSPTPTASPEPSTPPAPTLPAEAQGTSARAAKAFARHWVAVMNHAAATGSTARARRISAPSCRACEAMLSRIESVYGDGGSFEGRGWRIDAVRYQPFQPERQPIVAITVQVREQIMVEREGAQPQKFEGGRNQLTLKLRHTGQWQVDEVERSS